MLAGFAFNFITAPMPKAAFFGRNAAKKRPRKKTESPSCNVILAETVRIKRMGSLKWCTSTVFVLLWVFCLQIWDRGVWSQGGSFEEANENDLQMMVLRIK